MRARQLVYFFSDLNIYVILSNPYLPRSSSFERMSREVLAYKIIMLRGKLKIAMDLCGLLGIDGYILPDTICITSFNLFN